MLSCTGFELLAVTVTLLAGTRDNFTVPAGGEPGVGSAFTPGARDASPPTSGFAVGCGVAVAVG